MADKLITLKIPSDKVATALQGFLAIYPNNETIDDPKWVDPKDGTLVPLIAKYTSSEWVTEKLRRIIVKDVRRGLQVIANQNAVVADDDTIVEAV